MYELYMISLLIEIHFGSRYNCPRNVILSTTKNREDSVDTMDPQIVLFSRQYRQLLDPDFLAWPPKQLLRDPDVQAWLFKNLFDAERKSGLPPPRYQMRVLKPLLNKIEQSIDEPNEDVGGIFQSPFLDFRIVLYTQKSF